MPTLVIYRNGSLERQIELGDRDLRIGRGDQNDVVLTDTAKSVSRFHAEVRLENGKRYVIDLNSQNGTWVDGQRIQKAEMVPGAPVTIGPFALVLSEDAEGAVAPPPPTVVIETADEGPAASAPELPPAVPPMPIAEIRPAPAEPAPVAVPPVPPVAAPAAPAPPVPPAVAASSAKPAESPKPTAAAKTAPPAKPAKPAKPEKPAKAASAAAKPGLIAALGRMPKPLLFGLFALFVIGVGAVGVLLSPKPQQAGPTTPPPAAAETSDQAPVIETNEQIMARHLREGKDLLAKGEPARAIKEHFDRVLLINPDHPEALDLKMKAEEAVRLAAQAPSQPPATDTPATPAAQPAAAATTPKTPPPAATTPKVVPAGTAPPTTPAGAAVKRPEAARTKPGPVTRRPGETDAAYRARTKELQQKFQAGKAALGKGDYATAIATLDALVKEEPGYPEAAGLLAQAQAGRGKAAQAAVDVATAAEGSGDLPEALRQFQRAQELDPAVGGAAEGARRVSDRMRTEGEDAYKRARQYDALGRTSEAISMYEKAVRFLPAASPNAKAARDRLEALKK